MIARFLSFVTCCGSCVVLVGCSPTAAEMKVGLSRAVVLPPVVCHSAMVRVTPIATDRSELDGEIRTVVPGYSQNAPLVGATAYGGVFVARLRTDSGARFQKLLPWGTEAGTASELTAIARNEDGSLTFVDAFLRRRTTVAANGRYISHLMLRPPATTDSYGIDKRGVFVVLTQASKNFSERVPGAVARLVDDSRFDRDSFEFVTPSRHISPDGFDVVAAQRPLERNPIIATGTDGEMAINVSDSLELLYIDAYGALTRIAANGARPEITAHQRESSSVAFGKQLMPRDPAHVANYALKHMFIGRSRHQLIDAIVILPADRVALRRTMACPDRQLWHVLDVKTGNIVDQFTTAIDLSPLLAAGDTIFSEHRPNGAIEFAWYIAKGGGSSSVGRLHAR